MEICFMKDQTANIDHENILKQVLSCRLKESTQVHLFDNKSSMISITVGYLTYPIFSFLALASIFLYNIISKVRFKILQFGHLM